MSPDGTSEISDNTFRFYARYAFLTYPQIGELSIDVIFARLHELGCVQHIACREPHADGGHHFHVIARWPKPFHTRDSRKFDVAGHHPNIRAVRKLLAAYKYLHKGWTDDDGVHHDAEIFGDLDVLGGKRTREDVYRDAHSSTDAEQLLDIIIEGCPRDAIIYHSQIESFANKKFRSTEEDYMPPVPDPQFVPTQDLADWVENEFPKVIIVTQPFMGIASSLYPAR